MKRRVLIVESESQPCPAVVEVAARYGEEVLTVRTAPLALSALESDPYLVLLDGGLRGDATRSVAWAAAGRLPAPIVVVLGVNDTPEESFRLHEIGVRGYVAKGAPREAIQREIERALTLPPNLTAFAVAAVGKAPMQSVIRDVRRTMLDQALGLSRGSRSGAARLLAISRQAVQQIVRDREQCGGKRRSRITALTGVESAPAELRHRSARGQTSSRSSSSVIV